MRYPDNKFLLPAVAITCCLSPAASQAQAEGAGALEEIVVTARRREESLQDVPISISAISAATIERASLQSTTDLQLVTPSLHLTTTGSIRETFAPSIRGQRTNDALLVTDAPVALYFGDILISRPAGFSQSMYDIQSAQVLKGVQGTLFGRNTTGGAIILTPAVPTNEFEGEIQVSGGNYDLRQATGVVNIPIGDTLALRLAGKVSQHDGYGKNLITGQELDDQDLSGYRASLQWQPTDALKSLFIYDHYEHDQGGTGSGLYAINPSAAALRPHTPPLNTILGLPDAAAALARQQARNASGNRRDVESEMGSGVTADFFGPAYSRIDNWGIQNTTSWEIGAVTIKNIAGYRELELETASDLDGSVAALIAASQNTKMKFRSEELQFFGKAFADQLDWIVGLYYLKEDGGDFAPSMQFVDLTVATRGAAAVTRGETSGLAENTSSAGYAGVTYHVNDQWSLSGGLRYTEDKREATATSKTLNLATNIYTCDFVGASGALPISQCAETRDETFSALTYDATVQFKPVSDLMTYLSYRHGFRSGGFNGRARNLQQLEPFDPEEVDEIELGLKASSLGSLPVRLNAAVFYQDYQDIQRQVSITVPPSNIIATVIQNAAAGTLYGGELEIAFSPIENLDLGLFYSHIDGEYDEFIDPATGRDRSNEWLVFAPQHMGGLQATYTQPLGTNGDLSLTAHLYAQSESHMDDLDAVMDQAGFGLLNLRLEWSDILGSPITVGLWGRNVTEKDYRVGGVSIQDTAAGFSAAIWGEPRTYGVDLTYNFGAR